MELGILLEEWLGTPAARQFSDGWGGDAYALFGTPEAWSILWVVVWDSEASRDRFVEAVSGALPDGAVLESTTVSDMPATRYSVGQVPDVDVHAGSSESGS